MKDCKYCKFSARNKNNAEIYHEEYINYEYGATNYISVDMYDGKLWVECELYPDTMVESINIKYCPMCGRKL